MACVSWVWTPWDCTSGILTSSFSYWRGGGGMISFLCSYSSTLETPSIVIVYLSYLWLIVQLHKYLCWKSAGGGNILLESWRQSRDTLLLPLLTAVLVSVGVDLGFGRTCYSSYFLFCNVSCVCPQRLLCVLTSWCGSCLFLCLVPLQCCWILLDWIVEISILPYWQGDSSAWRYQRYQQFLEESSRLI